MSLSLIAEALGLSKATVSWVLSGQGDAKRISPATQKRIKDYAAEHNYHPNMLARSLSLGVTKTVGLLISSLADPFYSSIAKSVEEEAEPKPPQGTAKRETGEGFFRLRMRNPLRSRPKEKLEDQLSGLSAEQLRIIAEKLNCNRAFIVRHLQKRLCIPVFVIQSLRADHFCIRERGTLFDTECPKRHIRYTCHRSQDSLVFYFQIAYLHLFFS